MFYIAIIFIGCYIWIRIATKPKVSSRDMRTWYEASLKNDHELNPAYLKFKDEMWQNDPRNMFIRSNWVIPPPAINYSKILQEIINKKEELPSEWRDGNGY